MSQRETWESAVMSSQASIQDGTSRPESGLRVRTWRPGDEAALREMSAAIFGERRSSERWRWRFLDAPDGPARIHILEAGGHVVGHFAHAPFSVWDGGRKLRMAYSHELMVHPDYRNRGGMRQLEEAFLAERGFDLRLSFATDRSARLMERYGTGKLLGRLPVWIRRRKPVRSFPPGIRHGTTAVMRAYAALASAPRPKLKIEPLAELDEEVDSLAAASASFARCIRVRNAGYLRWRWLDEPRASWSIRAARGAGGDLRGLIVFGSEDSDFARVGHVVDLVALDAEALRSLLADAYSTLTEIGCHRVVCTYLDPRPWARRAFLRSGFLPANTGTNLMGLSLSRAAGPYPEHLDSWYITHGDMDFTLGGDGMKLADQG